MSMIPILFELGWKSLLVAGATLTVLRLAKDRTAGERSWIAHGGLIVLLALPLAAVLLPTWAPSPATIDATDSIAAPIAIPEDPAFTAATQSPAPSVPVPPTALALPAPEEVALWLYLVPLALLGGTMLLAVIRLAALRARANVMVEAPWLSALAQAQRRMGFKHGTALLVSDELRSPISWGVMRPIILLNPTSLAAGGEAEAIIAHELAHVARLDWAKLLLARTTCALLWFNPLVWMLAREAHQLREEAADDAVLMSEVDGADYAALLVNAARHDNQGLLIAAHGVAPGKDSLKRRIARVLDTNLSRRPTSAAWSLAGLAVVAGFAAPLAAFDPFTICTWDKAGKPIVETATPQMPRAAIELAAAVLPSIGAAQAPAAAMGQRRLTPDELIELKAVGVTGRDIAALREASDQPLSVEDAIQARAVGITPDYAARLRRAFPGAEFEEIVAARAVGIDPAEAQAMRRAWPGATLEDLTAARATGVTASYVAEMRKVFPRADIEDFTALRATGVDAAFVHEMQRSFGGRVTPETAIEARTLRGTPRSVAVQVRNANAVARAAAQSAAHAARRAVEDVDVDVDVDIDPPEPPEAPD